MVRLLKIVLPFIEIKNKKNMEQVVMLVDFILSQGKSEFFRRNSELMDDNIDKNKRNVKFKFSSVGSSGVFNERINFYPSTGKGKCQRTAVFVCIKAATLKFKSDPSNHVTFEKILKVMVQQVLGGCIDVNQNIILITDEINTNSIEEWKPNFRAMHKICDRVNIYYLDERGQPRNVNYLFGL